MFIKTETQQEQEVTSIRFSVAAEKATLTDPPSSGRIGTERCQGHLVTWELPFWLPPCQPVEAPSVLRVHWLTVLLAL